MLLLRAGKSKSGKNNLYSFARVGFSLAKINPNTSLPCVTIRRDSDSLETDIWYAPNGLIDVNAISAFCGSSSGFVKYWYDQFGTNHCGQLTTSLQPMIYNSGSQIVNEFGKPAIRFLDTSGAVIGQYLIFQPYHSSSDTHVGVFTVYSIANDGNFPQIVQSIPFDRGLVCAHNGSSRAVRSATIRSGGTYVDNGSVIDRDRTYVRYDYADRSKLRIFLDKNTSAALDIADGNSDFTMPTNYTLGGLSIAGTVAQDVRISCFIGHNTNISSNELIIRSNMFDFWRS